MSIILWDVLGVHDTKYIIPCMYVCWILLSNQNFERK